MCTQTNTDQKSQLEFFLFTSLSVLSVKSVAELLVKQDVNQVFDVGVVVEEVSSNSEAFRLLGHEDVFRREFTDNFRRVVISNERLRGAVSFVTERRQHLPPSLT